MDKKLSLAIAIIISALIISGTIYYTSISDKKQTTPNPKINDQTAAAAQPLQELRGATVADHILGNPQAPLSLIVYTDLECPWCKSYHRVLMQIMDDYGKQGKMNLVFRHFPIDVLHKKSRNEAVASECAAELGGNEKFWQYVNKIFEITPSNDGLDPKELPKIAGEIGLDQAKFKECLSAGKYKERIQSQYEEAVAVGGNGTPFSVIVEPTGTKTPVTGYISYNQLKIILDQLLNQI
jgi:protein-disulfide isomerase